MADPFRILTNHPGQVASPTWRDFSVLVPVPVCFGLAVSKQVLRLFRDRRFYDCMVLGAWPVDFFVAVLQAILPFRRTPCILIDCLWYEDANRIRRAIKRLAMKLMDRGVDRYLVWASRETVAYPDAFGLPRHKFVFLPYHTTIGTSEPKIRTGDYVFAGGNYGRDYPTLLEAVRGLPVSVEIACTRPELLAGLSIPENVTIRGYCHSDYLDKMASCRVNVVPLQTGVLHSGGQQTFLNSMYLGKPTIVTDPEGARDYITDGVDGILVPPSDPKALREAILWVLDNQAEADEMGERARRKAQSYTTEEHFRKIVALASEVVKENRTSRRKR